MFYLPAIVFYASVEELFCFFLDCHQEVVNGLSPRPPLLTERGVRWRQWGLEQVKGGVGVQRAPPSVSNETGQFLLIIEPGTDNKT